MILQILLKSCTVALSDNSPPVTPWRLPPPNTSMSDTTQLSQPPPPHEPQLSHHLLVASPRNRLSLPMAGIPTPHKKPASQPLHLARSLTLGKIPFPSSLCSNSSPPPCPIAPSRCAIPTAPHDEKTRIRAVRLRIQSESSNASASSSVCINSGVTTIFTPHPRAKSRIH